MDEINKEELRRLAEAAPKGDWAFDPVAVERGFCGQVWDSEGKNLAVLAATEAGSYAAQYIAAANPSTVLSLLDENAAQSVRIAELELKCNRLHENVEKRIKQGQRRIRANAELRAELEAWMRIARRAHVCVGKMAMALMVLKNNGQLTEMQASVVDELIGAAMQEETKP